ncbi:MAG: ATP-dependent Clp protease ATP-binding subunit ClpX [Lachnospiraceae bacterium]|jgi:ATP-dependent Clp protease ATP-binding subunit ClpX
MSDKDDEIRYCSICHRSEEDAGKLIDLHNGMYICPDCMQKMINQASSIDYNEILRQLQDGKIPDMNSLAKMFTPDTNDSAPAKQSENTPAVKNEDGKSEDGSSSSDSEDKNKQRKFYWDESSRKFESKNEDDDNDEKEDRKPQINFVNLGDLFGGYSNGPQQKVKKKKKDGPKPVFSADNIPAPHLLKAELDKYVIGQEKAKKTIAVAAYNHYKRVRTGTMDDIEIGKSNILLIGPTGSGKTYLVQTLARLLDVPLAITDATSLTEAGYIGDDVESCISKLLAAADNDVDKAQKGIVFIDEIDKLAKKQNLNSRDVSGEAVQQGLLKLLEGSEVEVPVGANSKSAMVPNVTVDTTNILFIVGGAFPGLESIIKQRLKKQTSIGFSAELKDKFDDDPNIMDKVTNDDLRDFGMIPEFLGRLPIVCTLQSLSEDMYVDILTKPKNAIIKQYQKLLALDGVDLEFEDGALRAIAKQAAKKETGARALRSIIEGFMLDIMYEVPKDKNIGKVIITQDYIEGKGGPRVEIKQSLGLSGSTTEQKKLETTAGTGVVQEGANS